MAEELERRETLHDLNNHLTVIVGFCELVLESLPEGDPHHADLVEIRDAARAALALVPQLG